MSKVSMRLVLTAALSGAMFGALFVTACEDGPDTSLPGNPGAGEAVYKGTCLACHGADGRGNGGVTGGDFIGQPERLQQDNAVLFNRIKNGILDKAPPMPAQSPALSDEQINDALAYIRREFGQ